MRTCNLGHLFCHIDHIVEAIEVQRVHRESVLAEPLADWEIRLLATRVERISSTVTILHRN